MYSYDKFVLSYCPPLEKKKVNGVRECKRSEKARNKERWRGDFEDKKAENGEQRGGGGGGEQGTAGIPQGAKKQKSRHCVSCARLHTR